jgi:hypothetical protein
MWNVLEQGYSSQEPLSARGEFFACLGKLSVQASPLTTQTVDPPSDLVLRQAGLSQIDQTFFAFVELRQFLRECFEPSRPAVERTAAP